MPSLKAYTENSSKSGVYILANVGGAHPITLQVTPLGEKILGKIGYNPGDDVPTRIVWSMYDVGILYTSKTLAEEPDIQDDPDEIFQQLNIPAKLSDVERAELIEYLIEYTGPNEGKIKALRERLQESTHGQSESDQSGAPEVTRPESKNSKPTVGEGRFLSIEALGSGYREITDRSGESYVNCFVLLLEVTNNAAAEWDFLADKDLSIILDDGRSLTTPLYVFYADRLSPWVVQRETISPNSKARVALIYPAEEGPLATTRLEYWARPLHRHAGINPGDEGVSEPERITISLDDKSRKQLSPLPDSLDFESVQLEIQTAASKARATEIDIALRGFEYSERNGVMLVFIEIKNDTPKPLNPGLFDFTVVSGEGYSYQEMGDGSYEGVPDGWSTVMISVPPGAKSRVMLPFSTNQEFVPAQILLDTQSGPIDVQFDIEEIIASRGAPESVNIEDLIINLR